MEKKKKGVMQSIPGWAWVLISLAAAILLWYALSINPKTARSFPFIPAILEAAKRMIDNGALGQDFCSSMISILAGFALGFITAVPIAFLMAWYLPVRGVLEPWIQFIRNIPPLAYVPLVVITAGVTIGEGCVIGAGSVVTRDIPANSLAAGNPCRVIRQITEADSVKNRAELF